MTIPNMAEDYNIGREICNKVEKLPTGKLFRLFRNEMQTVFTGKRTYKVQVENWCVFIKVRKSEMIVILASHTICDKEFMFGKLFHSSGPIVYWFNQNVFNQFEVL